MERNSAVSREARQYIIQQVQKDGIVTVSGVAEIVSKYYRFDPQKSFRRDVEQYSRRLLAAQRDGTATHMWKREATFTTEAQAEAYIKNRLDITGTV